jgi:hypothetical protein
MAKLAAIVIFAYGQPGHTTLQTRGPLLTKILIDKGIKPLSSNSPMTARRAIRCTSVKLLSPSYGSCSTCQFDRSFVPTLVFPSR